MPAIIEANSICKDFKVGSDTVHALKSVSLSIEKGSLTILKGRSGSGKTTLINILGALDTPTDGNVLFGDKEKLDITALSGEKRDRLRRNELEFVFQSVALISTMTAYENVELALRLAGYPVKDRKARARECISSVGLENRMNHFPYQLSGGEQQRVAIARAISHQPKLIFADEPTAELDSVSGKAIISLFKDLVKNQGITILMTTHDTEMMSAADKIYTLSDGEIVD